MDKETFAKLLEEGHTKAKKHGKVNWDKIISAMKKDKGIYCTTDVWTKFVKEKVNRYHAKEMLHKFSEEGKLLRIYRHGSYWWTADPDLVAKYGVK